MRALKILVVAMGVVLVAGIVALGFGIAYRIHHPRRTASATARAVVPLHGSTHTVTLPPGATILAAQSDGDRVMVRVRRADGGEELILLDWRSGATLATLTLK